VPVDEESQERQLNIHIDPEYLGGVYANFANVSFSDYEFTITFARIDHEVEEGEVPGVVVSRINMSQQFAKELLDARQDSWSKYSAREWIRNIPEAPPQAYRDAFLASHALTIPIRCISVGWSSNQR
jgi:hypothetical protein